MRRTFGAALTLLALMCPAAEAQNPSDTVVLRIEAPTGDDLTVSGSVRLRGGAEERKYTNVRTPFELRLPAQALEARFGGPLGQRLSGTMTILREGKRAGWVTGSTRFGSLRFYRNETGAYGFGPATASASSSATLNRQHRSLMAMLLDARTPCVRTAPMPSARLSSGDAMPTRSVDSAGVARMPVDRRVPCYQVISVP